MSNDMSGTEERYDRQIRYEKLGVAGQRRLEKSSVLVAGCGALGGHVASLLARAGVGRVRIVDRDVVQRSNLHRQPLFEEADVASGRPKAEIAADRLGRANATVRLEPRHLELSEDTADGLLDGIDLALDGLDNFEARWVLNEACVRRGIPWVFGGVAGASGMSLCVFPGDGPCLRCVFGDPPPPGTIPGTDVLGVIGPIPALIGAIEAAEAIKILVGSARASRDLVSIDLWTGAWRRLRVHRLPDCPVCGGPPSVDPG
jgi:adenylyltransferase/sulfurtransferase